MKQKKGFCNWLQPRIFVTGSVYVTITPNLYGFHDAYRLRAVSQKKDREDKGESFLSETVHRPFPPPPKAHHLASLIAQQFLLNFISEAFLCGVKWACYVDVKALRLHLCGPLCVPDIQPRCGIIFPRCVCLR